MKRVTCLEVEPTWPCAPASAVVRPQPAGFVVPAVPVAEWPGFPLLEQTVERIVRDGLDAGLSLRETCDHVLAAVAHSGQTLTPDDLQRWIRAHALSLT